MPRFKRQILKITVSTVTLSDEALSGLSYHPEAIVRLAAWQEIERRQKVNERQQEEAA
jgi:hypothetical protein